MAKKRTENKGLTGMVGRGDAGLRPADGGGNDARRFEMYKALVANVDRKRDLRRFDTICQDCIADADLAIEIFDYHVKNETR